MIVFDKPLEMFFEDAVKAHCALEKSAGVALGSTFFLVGSQTADGDTHVAHVAKCPLPVSALDSGGDALSHRVDDEWIADNAEKLVRLLPGGVNLVGLIWLSNKSLMSDARQTLIRALARIHRTTTSLSTLNIVQIPSLYALITLETPNGRPQVLVVDVVKRGPDSPSKITYNQLEWISLVSSVEARVCTHVKDTRGDFYKDFTAAILPWAERLLHTSLVLFDEQPRTSPDEPLAKEAKKRKRGEPIQARIYVSTEKNEDAITTVAAGSFVEADWSLQVRAAVPLKSSVGQAVAALKHGALRSLLARAELHYESMEVIEDSLSTRLPSTHQLPRLTTCALPTQPSILFSDYLFEEDEKVDSLQTFREVLQLQVLTGDLDDSWERPLDAKTLGRVEQGLEGSSPRRVSSSVAPSPIPPSSLRTSSTYMLAAAAVGVLALIAALLFSSLR